MKIFYINIDEFKKKHSKESLMPFADKDFKNEKRFFEHAIGRYIVKTKAHEIYNIDDTEIITDSNDRPVFKNADLYFSISHTYNMVAVCLDRFPCAIDIEYIKPRNFEELGKHFNKKFTTTNDFYRFWTQKEAAYKLHCQAKKAISYILDNEYYVTVASSDINAGFEN